AAAHGLFLFGPIDHAATALADLLAEFVAPDLVAGLIGDAGCGWGWRWPAARGWCVLMSAEQGLNPLTQWRVSAADFVEVSRPVSGREVQRRVNDGFCLA